MSAYVIVEFTVKDPEIYRDQYAATAGKTAKEHGAEVLAAGNWEILDGEAGSPQGWSCSFRITRRHSGGTTRLNISS